MKKEDKNRRIFNAKMRGEIPVDKLEYRRYYHSSSSMTVEGVFPEGMTREEVVKEVRGTFGGRFEYFGLYSFRYIAYTD